MLTSCTHEASEAFVPIKDIFSFLSHSTGAIPFHPQTSADNYSNYSNFNHWVASSSFGQQVQWQTPPFPHKKVASIQPRMHLSSHICDIRIAWERPLSAVKNLLHFLVNASMKSRSSARCLRSGVHKTLRGSLKAYELAPGKNQ